MTPREKVLYQQIHPAKLSADVVAAIISFYFFWNHELLIGLLIHILMPIAGSALVIRFADLDPLAASRLGRYIAKHMGPIPQGVRLLGDLVMSAGSWYHSALTMVAGLMVIVLAWLHGLRIHAH